MSTELVRYDAMCRAIAEAHRVDEVKDIRDKAMAMQLYARQAQNREMERQCSVIRLRAERKAGQILGETPNAKPGPKPKLYSEEEYNYRLQDLGITLKQSSIWQKLAQVPEERFEAALTELKLPSTNGLIKEETERREKMERSQGMEDRSTIIAVHNALAALSAIERRYVKDVVAPRYLKGE